MRENMSGIVILNK